MDTTVFYTFFVTFYMMYLKVLKNFTDPPSACEKGCFRAVCAIQRPCCRQLMVVVTQQAEKHEVVVFLSYSTCCWFITGTYRNYFSKKCLRQSVSGCSRGLNCIFCSISVSRNVSSCCQHIECSLYTRLYKNIPNMGPYQLVSIRV